MVVLNIACDLKYEVDGPTEFIFNIRSMRTRQQSVLREVLVIDGVDALSEHIEPVHGNRLSRARAKRGQVALRYRSTLGVTHVISDAARIPEHDMADLPIETLPFLLPSRYCASDRFSALAQREFGHLPHGYTRVSAVCDWVHRHLRFAPGTTDSTTSAEQALEWGGGVCRDFAHVVISMLRALNIPARFVTGYDYGAPAHYGPPDFHAYVEAFLSGRWWIFDATYLVPRLALVRIGIGRDAADCAFATLFGPTRFLGMQIDIEPVRPIAADDRVLALSSAGPDDPERWGVPETCAVPRRVAA